MTFRQAEYERIMAQIKRWPPDHRLTLVRDVLNTLPAIPAQPRRSPTLHVALGLLATDQPAPTDETIQQWLRERRLEKYG